MGRAERRAAARGKGGKSLSGYQFLFTPDEAVLLEEALHSHVRTMREELGDPEGYPPSAKWAYERSEQLRRHFQAAIDGWVYHSPAGMREQPRPKDDDVPPGSMVGQIQKALEVGGFYSNPGQRGSS